MNYQGYILATCLPWLTYISLFGNARGQTLCHNDSCISCLGQPMTLNCQENETVTGFIYAGFRSGDISCVPKEEEDCLAEPVLILSKILQCMWRSRSCVFTLQSYDIPRSRNCLPGGKPHYLLAKQFRCVADSNIHQICTSNSHNLLTSLSSEPKYMTSPKFPFSYSQNINFNKENCWLNITTKEHGSGIFLQSMFMDVKQTNQSLCDEDYIELKWVDTASGFVVRERFCGRDEIELDVEADQVSLRFVIGTVRDHGHQGWVIKYSAFQTTTVTSILTTKTLWNKGTNYTLGDAHATTSSEDFHNSNSTSHPTLNDSSLSTFVIVFVFVSIVILVALVMVVFITTCTYARSKNGGYVMESKPCQPVKFI